MNVKNVSLSDYVKVGADPLRHLTNAKTRLLPNSRRILKKSRLKVNREGARSWIDFRGRKLWFSTPDEPTRKFTESLIYENFSRDEYRQLEVEGMHVLDLGAAVGDTILYFWMKGAGRITAYECDKPTAALARENIRLNGVANAELVEERADGSTLRKFADRFRSERKVAKIDIEGGEYEVLLNSDALREYEQMILEYHKGYLDLQRKLEASGFEVVHRAMGVGVGILFAKRVG
jgi:16S rRNA G966 N2-methylase RsmD